MADTYGLGPYAVRREGSNPSLPTCDQLLKIVGKSDLSHRKRCATILLSFMDLSVSLLFIV